MPTKSGDNEFAKHPDYQEHAMQWMRCRDASNGQQAVKRRGEVYLPRMEKMPLSDYERYLQRALYFNATSRTVSGLTGAITRKPTTIEYPTADGEALESVGRSGESVQDMIARTVVQQLLVGRVGHLVDAPPETETGGVPSPYVVEYSAESIWNWRVSKVVGRNVLETVVLHERILKPDPGQGKYAQVECDQWRVLRLGNDPALVGGGDSRVVENGKIVERRELPQVAEGFTLDDVERMFYFQELWERAYDSKGTPTDDLVLVDVIVPRKSGGRLWNEIPFSFANATDTEPDIVKPPLADLVDVNLSHYMNSADLEWGRHFTALPTPWVAGADPKQEDIRIGSMTAWILPEANAKAGMLEFTGAGLGHLQQGMEHKERLMAVLGSRLLEDQKAGVEAAETVKLRISGDGAVLATIAHAASEAWTDILQWFHEWTNTVEPEILVTVNDDFNPAQLDATELAALLGALQAGRIDFETWFYALERGDRLPPGTSIEDFKANIMRGGPGDLEVPDNTEQDLEDDDSEDDESDEGGEGDEAKGSDDERRERAAARDKARARKS